MRDEVETKPASVIEFPTIVGHPVRSVKSTCAPFSR